ncbi:MAG TPA: FAD-linked oxidase C-terminal domain-containing protein [Kofleriaceae bacterium]|nr:FAD-linked oxidase C-terminal domain-containing protein [Kofleriaceae bacterium]
MSGSGISELDRPRVSAAAAEKAIAHLLRELGNDQVIGPEADNLEDYGHDEGEDGWYTPACATLCESAAEVTAVLAIAREHAIPVTPRGAGSGLCGGSSPIAGGIVLSTERMTRILEISTDDLVAVVEPGVVTGTLAAEADACGLFYPPDPASLAFCSIGGNAATNAGGPRAFKYGVTREYILGLKVALTGGDLLTLGRRTSKGVTGYDLVACFVGSEGTLGVTTELCIKLLPKPAQVSTILSVFAGVDSAAAAVHNLLRTGFRPRAIELADKNALDHTRATSRFRFPQNAGAIVLLELDGEPEGLEATTLRAGQMCEANGAIDVLVAQSAAESQQLWQARRNISPSLKRAHRHKIAEDICVPRGAIPEMLRRIDGIRARHNLDIATFGHAGDGNLHVNLLVDEDRRDPVVGARIEAALTEVMTETIHLSGTLSGEHGIGLAKQRFLHLEQGPEVIAWQRRLKRFWDPDNLLNPGKIFPARARCHE